MYVIISYECASIYFLDQRVRVVTCMKTSVITLGAHAQRGYCLSVCLSVTLHLTPRTSVRPRNDTIYPTGDESQKIKAVFSENAKLEREKANMQIHNGLPQSDRSA